MIRIKKRLRIPLREMCEVIIDINPECEKKIIDRLLASRDMTKQQIELRLANQMSVQQKKERANYSINNDGSKADLLKKVDSLINFINK